MATDVLPERKVSSDLLHKACAGLFVTIVAPVLVAVVLKVVDKVVPTPPATDQATAAMTVPPPIGVPAGPLPGTINTPAPSAAEPSATGSHGELRVTKVGPVVRLFNGRDRSGFYSHLGPPEEGSKPIGRGPDHERVFSARGGAMRVSGKIPGALITNQEYANYCLKLRYQWGDQTWSPREDRARSSGVLLHCHSPDGAVKQAYPLSVRCDLIEGSSGDVVPFGGPNRLVSINVEARRHEFVNAEKYKQLFCYEPGQPLTTLTAGFIKRRPVDLLWTDAIDYRGAGDIERPRGAWNDLECVCWGNRIVVRINGITVNDVTSNLTSGRIALQSSYAEISFRDIELEHLDCTLTCIGFGLLRDTASASGDEAPIGAAGFW